MIYFDNASTTWPKPDAVIKGMSKYFHEIGVSPSRGSYQHARKGEEIVFKTRKLLSDLLNIDDPDLISFTHNATHSLNIVLKGLLKPGDHVLISAFDHNSVIRPLETLKEKKGITYDVYKCSKEGFYDISSIEALINENTKLIVCNHASNVLGVISPITEIGKLAKKHNILFLVDCAQTAGLIPICVQDSFIDFLAGTAHKSLLGPSGVGFLYCKHPDLLDSLMEGGSGHNSISKRQPEIMPSKFEAGTQNYLGIAGFYESLKYIDQHSSEKLYEQENALLQYILKKILEIREVTIYGTHDIRYKIPLFSFNVAGIYATECAYLLDKEFSICVRGGLQCAPLVHQVIGTFPHGTVRVSLGHKNTYQEANKFIMAIKAIVERHSKQNLKEKKESKIAA
jgi:cysteine desulfurase family protein